MGIYRILWQSTVLVLAAAGSTIAFLSLPWETLLGLTVLAIIVGPLLGTGIYAQVNQTAAAPFTAVLTAGALALVGTVSVSGLIGLLGAPALVLLALLGVCSPAVLRRLLTRKPGPAASREHPAPAPPAPGHPAPTSPTPTPTRPPPPPCQSYSDAELCWRWRTSFAALQRTVSPDERLRLIETRSALLEELSRRDPEGFARWLNSGARAASDPSRFLSSSHQGHQRPDLPT